jgi:hypothetical protein
MMSVKERERLLSAYRDHVKRFDAIAAQRARRAGIAGTARPGMQPPTASTTRPDGAGRRPRMKHGGVHAPRASGRA